MLLQVRVSNFSISRISTLAFLQHRSLQNKLGFGSAEMFRNMGQVFRWCDLDI